MFRKTILLAALALPLAAGLARAEGEQATSNIAQTLSVAPAPTQSGLGASPVVVAGMERLTVTYGTDAAQRLATGGTPRLTTYGDGTWHTAYGTR